MRIGAGHHKLCANKRTLDGRDLAWIKEIRYLGVFIVRSFKFRCCIDQAKSRFIVLPIVSLQKSEISFGRNYIATSEAEMFAGSFILFRGV